MTNSQIYEMKRVLRERAITYINKIRALKRDRTPEMLNELLEEAEFLFRMSF